MEWIDICVRSKKKKFLRNDDAGGSWEVPAYFKSGTAYVLILFVYFVLCQEIRRIAKYEFRSLESC